MIESAGRPVALVTGASSGIGETFARQLAGRGYDLILVARRADRLESLAGSLPVHAQPVAADLVTEEGLQAVERAIRECPRLELLVNNAGFGTLGRFWEADIRGQEEMHRLHVLATVRLTHCALAGMVPRGRGSVVNVSSVAAFSVNPGSVSYCSTKAWMNTFTEALNAELRDIGSPVLVQALCPGFTYTGFHDTLFRNAPGMSRDGIPKFLWMEAGDIASASLRGLDRGKVLVVPGLIYKVLAAFLRAMPFSVRRRLRRPFRDKRV